MASSTTFKYQKAAKFNTDIDPRDGQPMMTPEMIAAFKEWTRAIGGEGIMEGVDSDIKKYISLGFCRNDFIKDMENSDVENGMFFDGVRDDPEYTQEEWEQAKIDEVKKWREQAKERDFYKSQVDAFDADKSSTF